MCGCCCLSEFFQTLINSFRSILWRLLCICRAQWSAEGCPWTPYVCKISLLCWLDLCVGLGTCLKFRSIFCQVLLGLFCRSAQHPGQLGMCTQLAYSRVFPAHVHRPLISTDPWGTRLLIVFLWSLTSRTSWSDFWLVEWSTVSQEGLQLSVIERWAVNTHFLLILIL